MPLVIDGREVLVDDEDAAHLSRFAWHIGRGGDVVREGDGVLLARYVLRRHGRAIDGRLVRHLDCNPLDNRKRNLVVSTPRPLPRA